MPALPRQGEPFEWPMHGRFVVVNPEDAAVGRDVAGIAGLPFRLAYEAPAGYVHILRADPLWALEQQEPIDV